MQRKKILVPLSFILLPFCLFSQTVSTMYFMENVPYRHIANPALQPTQNYYLSLPLLGYFHVNFNNNSVSMKDVFQTDATGNTVFFLNPQGNKNAFYNNLQSTAMFVGDVRINLLGAGFRRENDYFTMEISQRENTQFFVPKDLFKLLLFGAVNPNRNLFNLQSLAFNSDIFTDIDLGYSHQSKLNKGFFWGGKLKLLVGNNNKSIYNNQLDLAANLDQWSVKGNGTINSSGADKLQISGKFDSISYAPPKNAGGYFNLAGGGVGFDVGMYYKPNKKFAFSASLTDVGVIFWKKNATNANYKLNFTYNGVKKNTNDNYALQVILDSIKNAFNTSSTVSANNASYRSSLLPKLTIGAEYDLWQDKISVGLLSRTMIRNSAMNEELTASLNGKPYDWLNASLSCSMFNGRFNSFGAGIGLQTGFLHWFAAADYIGAENVPIPLRKINTSLPDLTLPAPYNTQAVNVSMGVTFVLNDFEFLKNKGNTKRNSKSCRCDESHYY